MHSIDHMPNDIARWGDTDNMDVEAAELAHKNWIKQQGGKTNQGPAVQKSMMIHTLRKEASALCCEAVQGASRNIHNIHNMHKTHKMHNNLFCTVQHESRTAIMDINLTNGKHATVELDSPNH